MNELLGYSLFFVLGVLFSWFIFLRTNKSDPANISADVQFTQQITALQARIKILENAKPSRLENMEIRDALRAVSNEQDGMRKELIDTRERVSKLVLNLLASYRPREPKQKREISA